MALTYNSATQKTDERELLKIQASLSYKDLVFKREWGTIHGNTNGDRGNTKAKADQRAHTIHLTATVDKAKESKSTSHKDKILT